MVNQESISILVVLLIISSCIKEPFSKNDACKKSNTNCPEHIIDIRDNQIYPVVKIGCQCWCQKNANLDLSGFCYDNLKNNCDIYGRLYTQIKAYNDDEYIFNESTVQGICPYGPHIPSFNEFRELIAFPGGEDSAAWKLISDSLWVLEQNKSIEKSKFEALPSGHDYQGSDTIFWLQGFRTRFVTLTLAGDIS